jgi:hypothetical protein
VDWSNLPEWLKVMGGAALGALGMFGAGFVKALADNKHTRSEDRVQFTGQVLERLAAVERQMQEEREYCERRMQLMKADYDERLERRDSIITELRQRDTDREARMTHLER